MYVQLLGSADLGALRRIATEERMFRCGCGRGGGGAYAQWSRTSRSHHHWVRTGCRWGGAVVRAQRGVVNLPTGLGSCPCTYRPILWRAVVSAEYRHGGI